MPIHGFHKSHFSEFEAWRPKVDNLSLPSLPDYDRVGIELNFSDEEVFKAPHDCCGDKSRIPACMTMALL